MLNKTDQIIAFTLALAIAMGVCYGVIKLGEHQTWMNESAPCSEWTSAPMHSVPARCASYFETHFKFTQQGEE
jgi:hypothetical protein